MPTNKETAELYENVGFEDRQVQGKRNENSFSAALGEDPVHTSKPEPKPAPEAPATGKGGLAE